MAEQKKQVANVGCFVRAHINMVIGKENYRFCKKTVRLSDR